jgi:hypothetical protein
VAAQQPPDQPRYELREGPLFLSSVYRQIGSVEEWDALRLYLDMALAENPTNTQFAAHVAATLWSARVRGLPQLVLLYEVHEAEQVVIYEALISSLE